MATSTKFANANAVVATGWTSPTSAYADDGAYATATPAKNGSVSSDFGFPAFSSSDIPDGAVINSVTVEVQWKVSTTGSVDTLGVQLHNPAGTGLGSEFTTTTLTTADAVNTQQVTSGIGLAALRSANVVVARVRASRGNTNTAFTASLDYVKVTVDYTLSSSGALAESAAAASESASGTTTVAAALSEAAAAATGAGSATVQISGVAAGTAPAATESVGASVGVSGAIAEVAAPATESITATQSSGVTGSASETAPAASESASATVGIAGSVAEAASDASGSASASVVIGGGVVELGGAAAGTAQGVATVSATVSENAPAATGSGSATVAVAGALSSSAAPATESLTDSEAQETLGPPDRPCCTFGFRHGF